MSEPWKSDLERLAEQSTPEDRALAAAISERLAEFGHTQFSQRSATILDLVMNVINPAIRSTDNG